MSYSSYDPVYENGIPVFRPCYEEFKDFRSFVNRIEPIGMKSGIVKVIPPKEWLAKLPDIPTALVDQIEIRNPIMQNINLGSDRGTYEIDNVEKRRKYTMSQWIKLCNQLGNQPPAPRGEKQRVLGNYKAIHGEYVSYDDGDFSSDMLSTLESKYWKGLAYGGSPIYGADLPGSLFDETVKDWNVAHLDSLLSVLPEELPGVTDAYLYCGMWKATFAWHLEDVDLPSINYIHFGAPKQWYTIPQSHHEQFYALMSALWPKESANCSEFLRHKTFLADPDFIRKHNIPVNKIVHHQREFMITFPYGYHAGFNYGFNVAESVNFAHDSWLSIGSKAKKCTCVSHSVGIDIRQIIDFSTKSDQNTNPMRRLQAIDKHNHHLSSSASSKPKRLGKCVLCPHIYNGLYASNKEGTALAHIICANLSPRAYLVGRKVYGLEDIERESFKLKCGYCRIPVGSCFQCSFGPCTRAYHGSCAAAAGVDYTDPHKPLCRFHRSESKPNYQQLDPETLLPGDVVQYRKEKVFSAGIVWHNDHSEHRLQVKVLPNSSGIETVNFFEIVQAFIEKPHGPFIEPLLPIKDTLKPKKRKVNSSETKTNESKKINDYTHADAVKG